MRLKIAKDRLLRGPLSDKSFGDSHIRDKYIELTYSRSYSSEEANSDDYDTLPESLILKHPGQGYLFEFQRDLVDQIIALVSQPSSGKMGLLALPTGGGKTRVAIWAILELMKRSAITSVLWLAPARELLDQAFYTVQHLWKVLPAADQLEVMRCYTIGGFPARDSPTLYLSTPQMLHSRLSKKPHQIPSCQLIIFDEAHHAIAPTFSEALNLARQSDLGTAAIIGLSATPGRREEEETENLVSFFRKRLIVSKRLGKNPVESLQAQGVLARLEFKRIELTKSLPGLVIEIAGTRKVSIKDLEANPIRFAAVVELVTSIASTERVLVFAGSIAHANAISLVLEKLGCTAAVISSHTPINLRERYIRAFEKGEIKVLVNKQILATGYDCPAVGHAVLTTPIGSPILFEQIVGRASRGPLVGGNEIGTIWQIDNNLRINGYPSSYYRFRDYQWIE